MQISRTWFACALVLAACGGKKDDGKATGSDKPTAGDTKPDEAKPFAGVKDGKIIGVTGDDISMLPLDADLIGGMNVAQMQLGGLWKTLVLPQLLQGGQAQIDEFKTKCGFDPITSIKTVSVALKNLDGKSHPDVVAVIHGLDKTKVTGCLAQMKDKATADKVTITSDVDTVTVEHDGQVFAGVWKNDSTLVLSGPHGSKDAVVKLAKGDDTLRGAPQFVDMFSKLNPSDSLWFLLKGSAKIVEKAGALGLEPVAVFGTVNAGDAISADIRIRNADAAAATKATQTLQNLAGTAKSMAPVDKVEATQDGLDVRIQALMSAENVKKTQDLLTHKGGGPTPPPADPAQGSAAPAPGAAP